MSTVNNQIISKNIFTQAGHLAFGLNYDEKPSTQLYDKCNRLVVMHDKKVFWFTTDTDLEHTNKLLKN